jgi:hypothetical protein
LLKRELKIAHRAEACGKNKLQMLGGLEERIGLATVGCLVAAAESATNRVEPLAQPLQQVINRLQCKRQAEILNGRFDAGVRQEIDQKLAQQGGADGVARQNFGQENRKRFSAAAALSAIGTKDPLAPAQAAVGNGGIIAVEDAVPV